jgi:DNA-binding CsgD family transcriptional regulator
VGGTEALTLEIAPAGVNSANPIAAHYPGCALVLIRRRFRRRSPTAASLRPRLACTDVEAQVAAALAAGHSPRAIAVMRGVSIHTVRSQIRALFARTHTRRIGELIAVLTGI